MSELDPTVDRTGLKRVTAQVFPIAADRQGIWLLSGEWPWSTAAIAETITIHEAVQESLMQRGIPLADVPLLHQTSCMDVGPVEVNTYLAVVRCEGPVLRHFPQAEPASRTLAAELGPPPTHGSAEAPDPRVWDQFTHGLRHLRHLRDTNATARRDMPAPLRRHLEEWEPELFRMYEQEHQAAC